MNEDLIIFLHFFFLLILCACMCLHIYGILHAMAHVEVRAQEVTVSSYLSPCKSSALISGHKFLAATTVTC